MATYRIVNRYPRTDWESESLGESPASGLCTVAGCTETATHGDAPGVCRTPAERPYRCATHATPGVHTRLPIPCPACRHTACTLDCLGA